MIIFNLSSEEIGLLQSYSRSPIELIRSKAQVILGFCHRVQVSQLAVMYDRKPRTISRWISDYHNQRLGSIFSGLVDNQNAAKLTKTQKQEIKEVLGKPPTEYGLPTEFWDVPTLKNYVQAEFGVMYESDISYHFLLKFSDLSFKYPDTFDIHRNEELISQRIEEIRQEIEPYLNDPTWEVFASDETGLMLQALTKRAWLKRGEKTIIKTERTRDRQNYIGFLNLKNHKCHLHRIARGQQQFIISATKKLLVQYPDKKICIIWDNGRFHKGKLIQESLKKDQPLERVHLISFPPYAPDTNPIEHVWRDGKQAISNHKFTNFEDLKTQFETHISTRTFPYKI